MQDQLFSMIDHAISDQGFVTLMGTKSPSVQKDIPAAFEMYSLLSFFLAKLPFSLTQLDHQSPTIDLTPSILHDPDHGHTLALIPIETAQLETVAYWISMGLSSSTVKAMEGLLALPFSTHKQDDISYLIPEWFAAFYVSGNAHHCVPVLTLQSITEDERFSDWVTVALNRMETFGLPCAQAMMANNAHIYPDSTAPKFNL